MPNHVHIVGVPEQEDSLAKMLRVTHQRHARRVNEAHGWRGHLWQERFHSFVMDEPRACSGVFGYIVTLGTQMRIELRTMGVFTKLMSSRIMAAIILAPLVTLGSCSDRNTASVYTPFEELAFDDPVLRACVLMEAERHGWERSGQMTRLVCTNPEGDAVQSLGGIDNLLNLQLLDLAHNEISDVQIIDRLERLTQLDLGFNRIQNVELKRLRITLNWLNLDHNQIRDIAWLANLRHVETLSISNNPLQDIEAISRLTDLKSLDLSRNEIASIDSLAGLEGLRELDLGYNRITDISALRGHHHLVNLHLHDNQISDVGPLAGFLRLEELNLSNNQVSDVAPLAELISLRRLNLDHNRVSDPTPLQGLGAIDSLLISENPLSCDMVNRLISVVGKGVVRADACDAPRASSTVD